MTDAAWGARTTDVLQKGTVYLGTLFFIFSLVLAILMGKQNAVAGKNFASDGASSAPASVVAPATPVVDPLSLPEVAPEAEVAPETTPESAPETSPESTPVPDPAGE